MGLQDGSYDAVMTGVCYSAERDETYDFSSPYYKRQIVGVVRSDSQFAKTLQERELRLQHRLLLTMFHIRMRFQEAL